jgi:hypothetical protein
MDIWHEFLAYGMSHQYLEYIICTIFYPEVPVLNGKMFRSLGVSV